MANNETKLQHYVPRTYLKNFADEKKKGEFYFHALPIADSSEEKIFETNIMRACAQNYIYTLLGNTKEERLLLENFYNENYESNYTAMYNLLVDPGKTKLSSDERNLIISTMVTMLFRTTKLLNQHNEFVFRNLDYIFELCRQTKSDLILEGALGRVSTVLLGIRALHSIY